jgi:hypothetical protein
MFFVNYSLLYVWMNFQCKLREDGDNAKHVVAKKHKEHLECRTVHLLVLPNITGSVISSSLIRPSKLSCAGNFLSLCSPNNDRRVHETPALGLLLRQLFWSSTYPYPPTLWSTSCTFLQQRLLVPCPTSELADFMFAWYRLHLWTFSIAVATYEL